MIESILHYFNNPFTNITSMIGLTFVIVGYIMYLFPPKKINSFYGYRTIRSMKNQESWVFAQRYSAKEMMKLGAVLILIASISIVFNFEPYTGKSIALGIVILAIILLFLRVERAIKTKFPKKELHSLENKNN